MRDTTGDRNRLRSIGIQTGRDQVEEDLRNVERIESKRRHRIMGVTNRDECTQETELWIDHVTWRQEEVTRRTENT